MITTELGRIRIGAAYRFHSLRQTKVDGDWLILDIDGDTYRVTQFGFDGVTRQERIHYVGLDGPDEGRLFSCSPADFVTKFRPLEVPPVGAEAAGPVPAEDKPAGFVSTSVHG